MSKVILFLDPLDAARAWGSLQYCLPCEICGKEFSSRTSLADHRAVHEGRTFCNVCNKLCSTVANLRRHTFNKMLNKCWQQSDWINHFSMSMSFLPVFFDQIFWAEWDISKEAPTWIPLLCQQSLSTFPVTNMWQDEASWIKGSQVFQLCARRCSPHQGPYGNTGRSHWCHKLFPL